MYQLQSLLSPRILVSQRERDHKLKEDAGVPGSRRGSLQAGSGFMGTGMSSLKIHCQDRYTPVSTLGARRPPALFRRDTNIPEYHHCMSDRSFTKKSGDHRTGRAGVADHR